MRTLLVVAVALVFTAPAQAVLLPPWKTVARSSASSASNTYTSINVNVYRAIAVQVQVQGARYSPVKVIGSVYCAQPGGESALRQFNYIVRRYKRLPLPLLHASCDYFVNASIARAASFTLALQVRQ